VDDQGKRRCGGDGCDGLVTLAHSTWQKAQDFEKEITSAMKEVDKLSKMVRMSPHVYLLMDDPGGTCLYGMYLVQYMYCMEPVYTVYMQI